MYRSSRRELTRREAIAHSSRRSSKTRMEQSRSISSSLRHCDGLKEWRSERGRSVAVGGAGRSGVGLQLERGDLASWSARRRCLSVCGIFACCKQLSTRCVEQSSQYFADGQQKWSACAPMEKRPALPSSSEHSGAHLGKVTDSYSSLALSHRWQLQQRMGMQSSVQT